MKSLKPINNIFLIGDSFSDSNSGVKNQLSIANNIHSNITTNSHYELQIKYYLSNLLFPFNFIYCDHTLSNGKLWMDYYSKVNECDVKNFSSANASINSLAFNEIMDDYQMKAIIHSYESKKLFSSMIQSELTKKMKKYFTSKDLGIFWLGNNDILFNSNEKLIDLFAKYKNNIVNLITNYKLKHIALIALINPPEFSPYYEKNYQATPSRFNFELNMMYEDLKAEYKDASIVYIDPNIVVKNSIALEYYTFPCYLGDELTNFKYDEFRIRSEQEEVLYASMFKIYESQLTSEGRDIQLNEIKKKYANTKCPMYAAGRYIFFDNYRVTSTTHKRIAYFFDKTFDSIYSFAECGPKKDDNYTLSTQVCNSLKFDNYFYKNHQSYDKSLQVWKNNWHIFDNDHIRNKQINKKLKKKEVSSNLIDHFRQLTNNNTIVRKIRNYQDILKQI